MTDPEEAAFLDQIAAEPDDDVTRLVYADWLEDRGCPDRADVIRRGVKTPKRRTFAPGAPAHVAVATDRRDVGEPLFGMSKRVVDVILAPPIAGVAWTTYKGLIAAANCSWATWLAVGDDLLERNWCPEVVLTDVPNVATDLNRSGTGFALIPGRVTRLVGPGEDPVDVVLRAEWPAVKRWLYPKPISLYPHPARPGAPPPRGTSHNPHHPPEIGSVVTLADGTTGILMSAISADGYAVVRPTGGNK